MRQFNQFVAGALLVGALAGLTGCKQESNLEQEVQKPQYSSVEAQETVDRFYSFRDIDRRGHTRDGGANTASLLTFAQSLQPDTYTHEEITGIFNYFRDIDRRGHTRDGGANTAAVLTIATVLNGGNREEVKGMFYSFRDIDRRGHTRDGGANTAANLTLSTIILEEGYILQRQE